MGSAEKEILDVKDDAKNDTSVVETKSSAGDAAKPDPNGKDKKEKSETASLANYVVCHSLALYGL
jgi:hypothetical protein